MREYYLFYINDNLLSFFKKDEAYLFDYLKSIYQANRLESLNAYYLINSMVDKIDKKNINLKIFNKERNNDYYMKYQNRHIINKYYTKEESIMEVNNFYLKIKSTKNFPLFFDYLKDEKNLFVCDFLGIDYFFLNNIVVK